MNIGDHIVYIHEGRKEWEGSKSDIMNADNESLNEFVFASDLFKKVKEAKNLEDQEKLDALK
jgi:phospholipid/cholesterol/gamma-HCH transport system ATP-binding protein